MRNVLFFAALLLGAPILATAHEDGGEKLEISKVNGAVTAEAGHRYSELSTVNGAVRIRAEAEVDEASTVNGSITVEDGAKVGSLDSVNGAVRVGERVEISGNIETVNGGVSVGAGSRVAGAVENVNGSMTLEGAEVGSIETVNGSLNLVRDVHVRGDLVVRKPSGMRWFGWGTRTPPTVVIGPGSKIDGTLTFEQDVTLYVHETAQTGPVAGAEAVIFSGDTPD
ncbi:MAG: hypothetical protein CVV17_10130 [Gammaproteobacteria bacterium HGW-Gammaproteobacteria-7]|nr:MAG: hypothetical protein CVV17_10130 [Gammaproteobacteria bacterium HGW-Gammaproteobacteria-7]